MSERIIVVVPIRSLRRGKTRLSQVLGNEAREALLRGIAVRVVTAAIDSGLIETVLVVSPDAETLAWAQVWGRRSSRRLSRSTCPVSMGPSPPAEVGIRPRCVDRGLAVCGSAIDRP